MKDNFLNLFFGRPPNDDFLEDLEALKKLQEKEVFELIERIVKWHTDKEIYEKEWSELTENLNQEQKEEKLKPIRALLFLFKGFICENVNKEGLLEDLETLELSSNYLDKFIELVKPVEQKFRRKSLRNEKPYENTLLNLDWRIDKKIYRDGEEKSVAVIELLYFSNGEKKVAQFDLNLKALKNLIYRLKKIEEEL